MNGCTQAFHRNAWTPLENRGKSVDMTGAIARSCNGGGTCSPQRGRLALFFGAAGVDCAVEVVFLQLAFDIRP